MIRPRPFLHSGLRPLFRRAFCRRPLNPSSAAHGGGGFPRLPRAAVLFPAVLAFSVSLRPGGQAAEAASWAVPIGGNAYLTAPEEAAAGGSSGDGIGRQGRTRWQNPQTVFSVFFRVDRPATLDLALRLTVPEGESIIAARIGDRKFEATAKAAAPDAAVPQEVPLGRVEAGEAGYLRVDLQGLRRTGPVFAELSDLVVTSSTGGLRPDFVKNNEGSMFYWGRRGPSVHLGYRLPAGRDIEYAYSELTVPEGGDPIGSYYMANGFGEGYFGIQTKSPTERWALFSVWSPFHTDNPKDIPGSDRVQLLAKGPQVHAGEFGNEGSGGQSYRIYPWKTGTTYRFLNSVRPDGAGATVYTAWISEAPDGPWDLMASFRRPKTTTHLKGFHSFLENFADRNGWRGRRSLHTCQWVRDTAGEWHEITTARLTGDNTARGRHRLDYAGGREGAGFFLRNGGFFDDTVALDQTFTRPADPSRKPDIDFTRLERN